MGGQQFGIISGAGPEAGLDLMKKLLHSNRRMKTDTYANDRDAPYVCLFQVPGIGGPRNPTDLTDEESDPFQLVWQSMADTIQRMNSIGIDKFCISCNTLHMLEPKIRRFLESLDGTKMVFVSMVESVEKELKEKYNSTKNGKLNVVVLGTLNVTDLGGNSPYSRLVKDNTSNMNVIELALDVRKEIQQLINDIKREQAGREHAKRLEGILMSSCVNNQASSASLDTVFIFACTELPLLTPWLEGSYNVIDPCQLVSEKMLCRP